MQKQRIVKSIFGVLTISATIILLVCIFLCLRKDDNVQNREETISQDSQSKQKDETEPDEKKETNTDAKQKNNKDDANYDTMLVAAESDKKEQKNETALEQSKKNGVEKETSNQQINQDNKQIEKNDSPESKETIDNPVEDGNNEQRQQDDEQEKAVRQEYLASLGRKTILTDHELDTYAPALEEELGYSCPKDNWRYFSENGGNGYTSWHGGYVCENVSYTGFKAYEKWGINIGWGDAKYWGSGARNAGYIVDNNPEPYSVGYSTSGWWGHTVWVESVNPDGTINYSEYNGNITAGFSYVMNAPASQFSYIHFNNDYLISSRQNLRIIATGFYVNSPGNPMVTGQSTWYAWYMRATDQDSLGALPGGSGLGNANNWDDFLGDMGYVVNNSPEEGAVFQTDSGYYGHVGYVTALNSDGSITVREMNLGVPYRVTESEIPASQINKFNYIH